MGWLCDVKPIDDFGVDENLVRTDASGSSFFLADGTNSTLALTDANGNLSSQYTYDPFGGTAQSGTSTNTFQFSGRENDGTGLYYMRARYYSPALQRFISQDPIGFAGGINLYAYAADNPVSFIDPFGLDPGGGGGEGGLPPNNGRTASHCLGVAAKAKGVSMGLDVLGAIPAFGNAVSAATGVTRAAIAVDHAITSPAFILASGAYGGYGAVTAGPGEATDSLVGAGSAGAGIGLALADASLGGTEAIPIVGNFVSVAALAWDGY